MPTSTDPRDAADNSPESRSAAGSSEGSPSSEALSSETSSSEALSSEALSSEAPSSEASSSGGPSPATQISEGLARKLAPKLVLSLVLGGLFAWLASRGGVPLVPSAAGLARVSWPLVLAYVGILSGTHLFRATRWRFLVAPVKKDVPFWEGVLLNWIGFFAIFALPLRLGELARPALGKLRLGIPISTGFGTVAVERVFDGLLTAACVVWALAVLPHRATTDPLAQNLPYYGWLAVSVFGAALAGLVLFLWQRRVAVRLIELTFGIVSRPVATKVAGKVESVAEGVRSIAHPRLAFGFLAESMAYWGLNAFGMFVLARAVGLDLTFGHAVALMGILAIGILLPAGPGLFGNFQLAVSVGLRLYFADDIVAEAGSVYVFLLYATQAVLICTAGIVPLYAMRLRMRDLIRTDGREPAPA